MITVIHNDCERTITVVEQGPNAAATVVDRNKNQVIFKNCAPFTNCVSEIHYTVVNNTKDLDIVMPMYNLIECSNNYSKTFESLWQYCKDEPDDKITDCNLFKSKSRFTYNDDNDGTVNAEIAVT